MSAEAKRVKILTLAELFLGLVLIVGGIAFVIGGNATFTPYIVGAEGLISLVVGGRGALIANVPARISKLAALMMVTLMVQLACVAFVVYLIGPANVEDDPVPCCLAAVPAVLSLVIAMLSRSMAKHAER